MGGPFDSLKQIDAGLLNVAYIDAGPADGSPALLRHGWPYDIHSYVDVVPILASAGYRVIVADCLAEVERRRRDIRSQAPTQGNSLAGTHIGPSRGA